MLQLLCRKGLSSNMKETVYKSNVSPAMLRGSEVWCLTGNEMGDGLRTEGSMGRLMHEVQLMHQK